MKKMLCLFFLVLFPAYSFGAGTCTQHVINQFPNNPDLLVLTFSCIADAADGSFPSTTTNSEITKAIKGYFGYEVRVNPGVMAPQALYDIVINDFDGIDLAGGSLANLSATVSARVTPWFTVDGPIALTITGNNVNKAETAIKIFLAR